MNRRFWRFCFIVLLGGALFLLPILSQCEAAVGSPLAMPGVGTFTVPEWLEASSAKGLEEQPNAGLQYDLIGFSDGVWHYARLVTYRLEQNLGPAAMLFGLVEANPKLLGELARSLLEKSLAENGGRILEWSEASRGQLGGRTTPVIAARLIMTEKVPLPMAATVYVFANKERIYALGLFAPDSDRRFWQTTFAAMAGKLRWE